MNTIIYCKKCTKKNIVKMNQKFCPDCKSDDIIFLEDGIKEKMNIKI